jgi:beta-galactosidase
VKPFIFCLFFAALIGAGLRSAGAADEVLPNGTGSLGAVLLDDSWRLWVDKTAPWQNDKLFLPDEVDLAKLPINPPTGGWDVLNDQAGISVTLPGTVEEHYWGQAPLPVAGPRPQDVVGLAGNYLGVSWWWRTFTPPALKPGERVILHFPGARQRSEIYVNQKLVGYNLVSEIPLTIDATDALKPGVNQLAVRITSPGGNMAWVDYGLTNWGAYQFPVTHGVGGIDGGVTMSLRAPVAVTDLYVANNPDPKTVTITAEVTSSGPEYKGSLGFLITRDGREVSKFMGDVDVPANGSATVVKKVTVANAELWDIGKPVLYRALAQIPNVEHSERVTDFGFRWFNAEGVGTNAQLKLNGRRVVIKSAISWGHWAPNDMFPDKAAVQREVDAVHALGLNAVQNHRHFPKAAVLDGFDHAGIFRYCEPGGGGWSYEPENGQGHYARGPVDTSGEGGAPLSFTNRYETAKVLAMIKAYRSHPSVLLWTLLNEGGADIHNENIFKMLRAMRALDPSRLVILKSGFGPDGEILGLPYADSWTYGDRNTANDSFWHDTHTCNDYQGVYCDDFYKSPTAHMYYTDETAPVMAWGEMASGASVDNVTQMASWYKQQNVPGYDRAAAEALSGAYEAFLDKYGFRDAYPTAETLFQQIGNKHYFSAAKVMEDARIADANDYIVMSGWESTTIDNHCALVDALRHPKGDPAIFRQSTAPELLVVRALHYVVAKGQAATVDVHIVNETNRSGGFTLHFSAALDAAKDQPFFTATFPVKVTGGEVFGELLKDNISFTPPSVGPVTMTLTKDDATPLLTRTEPLLVVDPMPAPIKATVACADIDGKLATAMQQNFGIATTPLESAPENTDVIVISSADAVRYMLDLGHSQRAANVQGTDDPGLYAEESGAKVGDLAKYTGLAPGKAEVELFFADPYFDTPNQRKFDIALNGKKVIRGLDIIAVAGGKNRATVQKVSADCPDGTLTLSMPGAEKDRAIIGAIRITDAAGKVTREVFRREAYTSPNGDVWNAARQGGYDWKKTLPGALDRVRKGARLVMLTLGGDDAGDAALALAQNNVLTFNGTLGFDRTSWMGYWYFSKKHVLLDGLPSGCVLDWPFQAAGGGDGLKIDAPGMDAVIAVGENHSPVLGFGEVVIPVGKGKIVLLAIPGLNPAFVEGNSIGFQPVAAKRLVYNAIQSNL